VLDNAHARRCRRNPRRWPWTQRGGRRRWHIDSLAMPMPFWMQCIPFGPADFMTVAGNTMRHFKGGELLASPQTWYNLDGKGYAPTYDSLLLAWVWGYRRPRQRCTITMVRW